MEWSHVELTRWSWDQPLANIRPVTALADDITKLKPAGKGTGSGSSSPPSQDNVYIPKYPTHMAVISRRTILAKSKLVALGASLPDSAGILGLWGQSPQVRSLESKRHTKASSRSRMVA